MVKVIGQRVRIGVLLALSTCFPAVVWADVLHINGGLSTGHFIDGINVTDEEPLVFLNADWSFDNGVFTGADCYQGTSERGQSLSRGCHAYIGYFTQINDAQALTFELRHKRYLVLTDKLWTDFELSVNWHTSKNFTLSAVVNDNWLDQGHVTISVRGDYAYPINDRWSSYISAGLLRFEGSTDLGSAEHLEFGVKYQRGRWGADLSAVFADEGLEELLWFDSDVNENQLRLTISYQLY